VAGSAHEAAQGTPGETPALLSVHPFFGRSSWLQSSCHEADAIVCDRKIADRNMNSREGNMAAKNAGQRKEE
jgi:hypothetical protein